MAGPPTDLIDVPDDLVDVPAAGAAARTPEPWSGASQGVPRPIGVAAPPVAPPRPQPSLLDRVRGVVEAAVELVAGATGGLVGMAGGTMGGLAGAFAQGEIGTQAGARRLQDTAMSAGKQGAEAVSGPVRSALGLGSQMSPTGQEYTESVTGALQQLPAAMAGPRGMVGTGPRMPIRQELQHAGVVGRQLLGPEIEAARTVAAKALPSLPKVSPEVATAVKAGVPVAPHQLTKNRLLRFLGESAEAVPLAGGETLRKGRVENFSRGLARIIDPDATGVLDDVTFRRVQDAAGERIGEIAGRTDVPRKSVGDLMDAVKDNEPSIRETVSRFVRDVDAVGEQHGGTIPGPVLRELRTRASKNSRETTNGDLKMAWDRIARKLDDGLAEHAPEGDMAALLEARRQYAISKTLEPLVAKHTDGMFPPTALGSIATRDKAGKRRMARGEGGDLGDYASLGRELLRDQVISGTPTTHLAFRGGASLATGGLAYLNAPLAATLWGLSAAYNKLGPGIVKRMVERETRKAAPEPPAGPAPLELAPEGPLPARPAGEAPASPLGDLTPDWETVPGAAPARAAGDAVPAEGLVPAVDDLSGPARVRPAGAAVEQPPARGAGMEIPAVPGRPDLPEAMVAGGPAEVAATEVVGTAMQAPEAALARSQQEAARLKAKTASPEVQKVFDEHERVLKKRAAAAEAEKKRAEAAAEMRRLAAETADPELRDMLHARAKAMEGAELVPAGKAKETEARAKPAKEPDKPLPVAEATEVPVEAVEAAPVRPGPLETLDVPASVRPPRTEPRVGKAGPSDKLVPGRVYRDSKGNRAIYRADGSWQELD